ncbi:hypothetical protein Plhal304r1_c032g0103451 [Plasmopara halstedii]
MHTTRVSLADTFCRNAQSKAHVGLPVLAVIETHVVSLPRLPQQGVRDSRNKMRISSFDTPQAVCRIIPCLDEICSVKVIRC